MQKQSQMSLSHVQFWDVLRGTLGFKWFDLGPYGISGIHQERRSVARPSLLPFQWSFEIILR